MNTSNPRLTHILFTASVVMITVSLVLSVVNVATVLSAPHTTVAVPNLVGFEGFLADGSGNPITDGTYSITFKVYDAATAGTVLWTETQSAVQVTKGLYAVTLGSVTALGTNLFDGNRWIGVTVGTGSEMTPRTRVSSVPFALNANWALNADHATNADLATNATSATTASSANALRGYNVAPTPPANGQSLTWDGTNSFWYPSSPAATHPTMRVYRTTDQGIGFISFNGERFDANNMHDNSVNPTRITIPQAGKYLITATARVDTSSSCCGHTGYWYFRVNGTNIINYWSDGLPYGAGSWYANTLTTVWDFAVNDYVEFYIGDTNTPTIKALSAYSPEMSLYRLGD
jgi:hypothetical protein